MDEVSIIHSNAAIAKFWNLLSPIIHALQAESGYVQVCGHAQFVLRVRDTTDRLVMFRAPITVMNYDWLRTKVAQFLQCKDQFSSYGATVTVWTCELGAGEMWRQVTHADHPLVQYLSQRYYYRWLWDYLNLPDY
jgi:hypothetical protein